MDKDFGGFDVSFVNTLLDDYKCSICYFVLRDPQQLGCGHRFCKSCLQNYLRNSDEFSIFGHSQVLCPICRSHINKSRIFEDKAVERTISGLLVACKYFKDCKWTCELREINDHLKCCPFAEVQCPNIPCKVLSIRRDLEHHLALDCNYRSISCKFCQTKCVYQNLEAHWSVCMRFPLECFNKCGKKDVLRSEMSFHVANDCILTIHSCEFFEIGCLFKGNEREQTDHNSSSTGIHLNLAVKKLISIEKASVQKDKVLSNMQIKISDLEKRNKNISFNKYGTDINQIKSFIRLICVKFTLMIINNFCLYQLW